MCTLKHFYFTRPINKLYIIFLLKCLAKWFSVKLFLIIQINVNIYVTIINNNCLNKNEIIMTSSYLSNIIKQLMLVAEPQEFLLVVLGGSYLLLLFLFCTKFH